MIDLSGAIAVTALFWTIWQQYAINKMCAKCPFRTYDPKEETGSSDQSLAKA